MILNDIKQSYFLGGKSFVTPISDQKVLLPSDINLTLDNGKGPEG